MNDVFERKLKEVILKNTTVADEKRIICDETDLIKDLEYDSLSFVKLIIAIESEFGIEIPEDDIEFDIIGNYRNLKECVSNLIK